MVLLVWLQMTKDDRRDRMSNRPVHISGFTILALRVSDTGAAGVKLHWCGESAVPSSVVVVVTCFRLFPLWLSVMLQSEWNVPLRDTSESSRTVVSSGSLATEVGRSSSTDGL